MHIKRATVSEYKHKAEALVRDYFARTKASEGMDPLKFKWDMYEQLQDHGYVMLIVMLENTELVGFALYIIQPHLHHDQLVASCTLLGVKPEYRRHGIGKVIVEHAIRWLREIQCTHIVHHHRTIYDTVPLFDKMGFKRVEVSYMKELK